MFLYCGLIFDALKIMGCLSRFFKTTNGDINTARLIMEITTNENIFFFFSCLLCHCYVKSMLVHLKVAQNTMFFDALLMALNFFDSLLIDKIGKDRARLV